jgi:hypothetical protein
MGMNSGSPSYDAAAHPHGVEKFCGTVAKVKQLAFILPDWIKSKGKHVYELKGNCVENTGDPDSNESSGQPMQGDAPEHGARLIAAPA